MAVESKLMLKDETIKKMQKLIQANIDSVDGFREAAEDVNDDQVASLFRAISSERSQMAAELQEYVELNMEEPVEDGSATAAVHRAWINIRSMLNSGDPYVILIEAERGEDHIKRAYEEVLLDTAGSAMNQILQSQYARVKSGHDQIRDLRDRYKNKK